MRGPHVAINFERDRERANAFFHEHGTVLEGRPHLHASNAAADLSRAINNALQTMETQSAARLRSVLAGGTDLSSCPPLLALVDLGVGKTTQTIEALLRFVDGDFGENSERPQGIPRRVGILLPDHKLARELASRIDERRPGACFVWKGIEQPVDPDNPDSDPMCLRVKEDIPTVLAAGGRVSDLCGHSGGYCPHHPKSGVATPCTYRRQHYGDQPIVIVCGAAALTQNSPPTFHRKVNDISIGPFDLIVVDEVRFTGFLGGFGPKPYIIAADSFSFAAELARVKEKEPSVSSIAAHRWRQLRIALESLGDLLQRPDPITLGDLRRIELFPEEWRAMRRHLFSLLFWPDVDPALSGEALRNALAADRRHNGPLLRLTRLFHAVAQLLADESLPSDASVQTMLRHTDGFQIHWREQLAKAYTGVPTLLLDATANLGIMKALVPGTELLVQSRAIIPPAVEIVQVSNSLHPYSGWVPNEQHSERVARRVQNNVARLSDLLDVLVGRYAPGEVAAIVPLRLEKALQERWREQGREGIHLAHFNAIRGQNAFCNVRCLVVWSRPSPSPDEVERMAATISGRPVQKLPKGDPYLRGRFHYWMRDGKQEMADPERHPDLFVEQVRWQIVEAELLQAIGRARAVWRSPERPLTIIIGTSVPTELPINRLVGSDELFEHVTPIDAMIARGLLVEPTRGFGPVCAAALGLKPKAVEDLLRSAGGLRERIAAHVTSASGSHWRMKLSADSRYSVSVCLRDVPAGDRAKAQAFLRTFNRLDPADLSAS